MSGRLWRKVLRLLTSPRLVLVLIVLVGIWSAVATAVPQEASQPAEYGEWAVRNASLVPIVRGVGLHRAFGSPVFVAAIVLLALSSASCAWRRSRAALVRTRLLREASGAGPAAVAQSADIEIAVPAELSEADALSRAAVTLDSLGIRTRPHDGVLLAVSPWWSAWGSALFHWALVALVASAFMGILLRSEGSMAIAVGDQRPDEEDSYVSVESGRLHSWVDKNRVIRVDDFDPAVEKDGMDLGAVPTVSVLDEDGRILVRQQVYPNKKLHSESLSIYQPAVGLSVRLALTTRSGRDLPEVVQLVDFSQEASGGTVPVQPMVLSNNAGQVILRLEASVPLDPDRRGGYGEWVPRRPSARVVLTDGGGTRLLDKVVRKGQSADIEGGGSLKVVDVGWYSSLVLVDDPTIPFVYGSMIVAMLGLALSVSTRQQLVVVALATGEDGTHLVVRARLWRYVPTTVDEMRTRLASSMMGREEGAQS